MLIEFAVTNFRSFKERQVLSLLPSGKIRERYILPLQSEKYAKVQVLPTAVLYGPNNSGKTNFLQAIDALQKLVRESGNFNSDTRLVSNNFFELDIQTKGQPTTFEIEFIAPNQKRYNYIVAFDTNRIISEELYVYNITKTGKVTVNTLFERERENIKFPALKGVKENIHFEENQLFLSRGDIEGNKELKEVYSFFSRKTNISSFIVVLFYDSRYLEFTTKTYKDLSKGPILKLVENILKETDTGIIGLEVNNENESDRLSEETLLEKEILTNHTLFNGNEEVGTHHLSLAEESLGTRKLLGLLLLILASLFYGRTIFIDEMDTSMHTEIITWLISLFNNPETNPNKAQLIITTHNITLLDKQLYDKDQVFIVEKNKYGASELYSFSDITGLRANNKLSDFYETGRLGGVPHIAKPYLQHLIRQLVQKYAKTEVK